MRLDVEALQLADGQVDAAPAGVVGYVPRDTNQAQQLFLLRAIYRL